MAIKDDRLKQFFSKQKVGAFDALVQKGKVVTGKSSNTIQPQEERTDAPKEIIIPHGNEKITSKKEVASKFMETQLHGADVNKLQPLAFQDHSVSYPLAKREDPVSVQLAPREQFVSLPESIPLATSLANNNEIIFSNLRMFSKKERELLTLIFLECRNNGSLTSPPISTEDIRSTLVVSAERVRNLVFRIVKKGGIKKIESKSGQSAYRIFELSKSLYQIMLDQQNNILNPLAKPVADSLANTAYSSSSDNKTTTTDMPEEWKLINTAPLREINFGGIEIRNIFRKCPQEITAAVVQDSINHFAFGLLNNPDRYKNMTAPAGVLVSQLSQGNAWKEDAYVSPEELAKKEKEIKINKFFEDKFKSPKFLEWLNELSNDERDNFVPKAMKDATSYLISKNIIQKEWASKHFDNVIWPSILADLKTSFEF